MLWCKIFEIDKNYIFKFISMHLIKMFFKELGVGIFFLFSLLQIKMYFFSTKLNYVKLKDCIIV